MLSGLSIKGNFRIYELGDGCIKVWGAKEMNRSMMKMLIHRISFIEIYWYDYFAVLGCIVC